jgi:argininosuccinate lyase
VHLGRSRNDQVLTALRSVLRDAVDALAPARVAWPTRSIDSPRATSGRLPGYTHMQQAMPSSVALWAGDSRGDSRRRGRSCSRPSVA